MTGNGWCIIISIILDLSSPWWWQKSVFSKNTGLYELISATKVRVSGFCDCTNRPRLAGPVTKSGQQAGRPLAQVKIVNLLTSQSENSQSKYNHLKSSKLKVSVTCFYSKMCSRKIQEKTWTKFTILWKKSFGFGQMVLVLKNYFFVCLKQDH